MNKLNTLAFLGSPEYALPTLYAISDCFPQTQITVLTQPDRPKGRGKETQPTAIKKWAIDHCIPVLTPETKTEVTQALQKIKPDIIIVIAYGMILEKTITDQFFCVNVHGSILPRYRGASPIQSTLLNGDLNTGVTLIKMNEKMDEGDIIDFDTCHINEQETGGSLGFKLADLSAQICLHFLKKNWLTGNLKFVPQDHSKSTYCRKIKTEEAELLPQETAEKWSQKIRAYSPTPGAYISTATGRVKILKATFHNQKLSFEIVQPENKKPMTYAEYCRGYNTELLHPSC